MLVFGDRFRAEEAQEELKFSYLVVDGFCAHVDSHTKDYHWDQVEKNREIDIFIWVC